MDNSKHYAMAITCGAKRGPKNDDLTFSPASLRDFLKAIAAPVQEPLSELQKDAINLLFALHDAWPYVHERCTIAAKKKSIQALISKHGEFAGMHPVPQYPMQEIVNRFLCYKLPKDFQPDGGISFKRESDYEHPEHGRHRFEPTGTNLLTAEQAKAMFEHVLGIKQTK